MRLFQFATLTFLSLCSDACAWSDAGHKIICEIAFRYAQPTTRATINNLIQNDGQFQSFSESCVFPDHPRIRRSEHYVNLPRDAKGFQSDKCPLTDKCVLTAIDEDAKILSSKLEKPSAKLTALKSLGHWIGDIHQPLHVSFQDDAGGNAISVSGQCSRNLHAVWDSCLVQYAVGPDITEAVTDLMDAITPQMIIYWNASGPRDWANESFRISEDVKTGYCVIQGAFCKRPEGVIQIDGEYLDANEPIVKEQLRKAGVRLAHILDRAFED